MDPQTVKAYFTTMLDSYDMVLGRVSKCAQLTSIAELGKVYRTKFLFPNRYFAIGHKQIDFVCGGSQFGDISNFDGEIGLLFLRLLQGNRPHQRHFQGHYPIERHADGLWCLLYGVQIWELTEIPSALEGNYKPNLRRLDRKGKPFDTWIRFEVLEAYLMGLIAEIDQKPCEPFEPNDFRPWLNALPLTSSQLTA